MAGAVLDVPLARTAFLGVAKTGPWGSRLAKHVPLQSSADSSHVVAADADAVAADAAGHAADDAEAIAMAGSAAAIKPCDNVALANADAGAADLLDALMICVTDVAACGCMDMSIGKVASHESTEVDTKHELASTHVVASMVLEMHAFWETEIPKFLSCFGPAFISELAGNLLGHDVS